MLCLKSTRRTWLLWMECLKRSSRDKWRRWGSEWRIEMPTRLESRFSDRSNWQKFKSINNWKPSKPNCMNRLAAIWPLLRCSNDRKQRLEGWSTRRDWCRGCARSSATHARFTSRDTLPTNKSSTRSLVAAYWQTGLLPRVTLTTCLACLSYLLTQRILSYKWTTRRKESLTPFCLSIFKQLSRTICH